jgi:hypothetical protein
VIPDVITDWGALIGVALGGLAVLHRLEAEKEGAAEFNEVADGRMPPLRRRLYWYLTGLGLIAGVMILYPESATTLNLQLGEDRLATILFGVLYAAIGVAQAVIFALWRYRRLRFPPVAAYPGAMINDIGTAFIDEAVFRGIVLGYFVIATDAVGYSPWLAILGSTILYVLATRVAAPGRPPYMLFFNFGIGLIGGYLTLLTGGIGAAFLGHAVSRFSVFLVTGHAGQVTWRGTEEEEIEKDRRPPEGWRVVEGRH